MVSRDAAGTIWAGSAASVGIHALELGFLDKMQDHTYVLGINYRSLGGMEIGHHPSAALLEEGFPVAMCEEERFVRIKEAPLSIRQLNDFVYAFLRTSEKGNLMGLAPYGSPKGMLDGIADENTLSMRMDLLGQHAPFPESFQRLAGAPRRPGEQRHKDLAADLQRKIDAIGLKIVDAAVRLSGERNLCLAGGCALYATLNGKIGRSGMVDRLFIEPEAGDAGGRARRGIPGAPGIRPAAATARVAPCILGPLVYRRRDYRTTRYREGSLRETARVADSRMREQAAPGSEDCRLVPSGKRMGSPRIGSAFDRRRSPARGNSGPCQPGSQVPRSVASICPTHEGNCRGDSSGRNDPAPNGGSGCKPVLLRRHSRVRQTRRRSHGAQYVFQPQGRAYGQHATRRSTHVLSSGLDALILNNVAVYKGSAPTRTKA